jgi:myo-inositol-1(or 4)-monophosphatase
MERIFGPPARDEDPKLSELASVALEAARAGASVLKQAAGRTPESIETKTSATDLVSEVDLQAEAAVTGVIRRCRPDDAILGEEGTERPGSSGVRWVVDPLDGTVNFVFGVPQFAVSVGAQLDGACVVGVVVDPCRDEIWTAVRARGARLNGRPLVRSSSTQRASGTVALSTALVSTGFGYRPERRRWQAQVMAGLLHQVRDIRRFGAASLDLCWTAAGRFDIYYEWGLNPWDLDAGSLICSEAGLRVETLEGRVILAASPQLWEPMRGLLEVAGGLEPPPGSEERHW